MDDLAEARALAAFICPAAERVEIFEIEGPPRSKARPRLGPRGNTYAPDHSVEEATAWEIRARVRKRFTGGVAVGCIFYRPNRQRIDADNLLKHILDAATRSGAVWADDVQATVLYARVEYDPARPRTVVVMGDCETTMQRRSGEERACASCRRPFVVPSSNLGQRFCSRQCAGKSRSGGVDLAEPVPCAFCRAPFVRAKTRQQYCSTSCRARGRGRPLPSCRECGRELTRHGYVLCRECWLKSGPGRRGPTSHFCAECGQEFSTDDPDRRFCDESRCLAAEQANRRGAGPWSASRAPRRFQGADNADQMAH